MLCSGPRTPDLPEHRRLQPDGRPLHRRRDQLHLPAHRRPLQQHQQPAPGISRKAIQETIALLQQVRPPVASVIKVEQLQISTTNTYTEVAFAFYNLPSRVRISLK